LCVNISLLISKAENEALFDRHQTVELLITHAEYRAIHEITHLEIY